MGYTKLGDEKIDKGIQTPPCELPYTRHFCSTLTT